MMMNIWTSITSIYYIRIISSYHPIIGDPTSRSHRRAKAALSHPWSLPKNAARYDSTDDVYDVRLGFLPKCIYSEKKKQAWLSVKYFEHDGK